jgi:UTP--glucose-1-phosphate uridylyltransferase
MTLPQFKPFADKMTAEGLNELAIRTFETYYEQLVEGVTGLIPESEIEPVDSLPDVKTFPDELSDVGKQALKKTVVIKLNGGLGTSMGLEKAKSLLAVKSGLSFLDIIAKAAKKKRVSLIFMNSYSTSQDTKEALKKYSYLWKDIPLEFLQNKVPKVAVDDLTPATYPSDRSLEWCPPGHGDLYTALLISGILDALLEKGFCYAFVSNADNLGAVIDDTILGYFVKNGIPFLMETADRTEADKKGGHLARSKTGKLILREIAQCPDSDLDTFQNVSRHKYFNTNTLWMDLRAVKRLLTARNGVLGLSMIRNRKTVNPRDPKSDSVYQLESAMGSAIELFEGARAVRVPKSRFAPVKTTSDLLGIRSDAYVLDQNYRLVSNPERQFEPIVISLDPKYYKMIDDLEARLPNGTPSLIECKRLSINGDIVFGKNVRLKGTVSLVNHTNQQVTIPDGSIVTEGYRF